MKQEGTPVRLLDGEERSETLAFGNGRCERCGFTDLDPVAFEDVGFPEIACRECADALAAPGGDTHFVALLPEMTQASVCHLVRAVAIAGYGASRRCDPELVLDLLRRGAAPVQWAAIVRSSAPDTQTADEARLVLKRAARDTFAVLLERERSARAVFGTSCPDGVAAILTAMSPGHRKEAERSVRIVPRRMSRSRIESFETPIG